MAEKADYNKLNEEIAGWAKYQAQRMRRMVGTLTLKDKHAIYKLSRNKANNPEYKELQKSIGSGNKKEFGQITRVNFRFSKQGIWLEHGVGKGRRVRSAVANPKPWLVPTLDPSLNTLADLIADNYADIAAGEIKFVIPGVIDRRIKINNG